MSNKWFQYSVSTLSVYLSRRHQSEWMTGEYKCGHYRYFVDVRLAVRDIQVLNPVRSEGRPMPRERKCQPICTVITLAITL